MLKGLVMEGGAMRGLFTAGVNDVLMENEITFDGAVGVSAGAAFGCNYKSHQIGRVHDYVTRFCDDDRFGSWKSWWKTGDYYGAEFSYKTLPNELCFFDRETFRNNPMKFYVVVTDINSGKPVYRALDTASDEDIAWMQASASMPLLSNIQRLDGLELLDGGMSDSIPIHFMESLGYDRNVVILTQPKGFVKPPNPALWLIRICYRKHPGLVRSMAIRHEMYNATTQYICEQEQAGKLFVIRPHAPLNISGINRDVREVERVYQLGRQEGEKRLDALKEFLKG